MPSIINTVVYQVGLAMFVLSIVFLLIVVSYFAQEQWCKNKEHATWCEVDSTSTKILASDQRSTIQW